MRELLNQKKLMIVLRNIENYRMKGKYIIENQTASWFNGILN